MSGSAVALVAACLALAIVGGVSANQDQVVGVPHFVEDATLEHTYDGPQLFAVGGGVAALDCNDDGLPDLYVAGGSNPASLLRNDSTPGGALQFTRIADPVTDLENVNGAYPIDHDGDGHADLVVLRASDALLLRGLGDCRFERSALVADTGLVEAFSASWEDQHSLPTLAFGHYLKADSNDCDTNTLYRPTSHGYGTPTTLAPGYCALGMLFSDWDRSGRRDLRITNDRQYYVDGEDQLWRVAPGQPPRLYTDADGWVSMQIWGMGIASYDVTGDGLPEVFLTSQGDNKLQTLALGAEQPRYRDIALRRGVTAAQPFSGGDVMPSTAWHADFQDVNNDGLIDLFVAKGNVSTMREYAQRDPSNLFLGQPDGTFREAADEAGVLNFFRGRGAAVVDLNADGMLDLVEVNYGGPLRVWRNVGSGSVDQPAPLGNWLAARLHQPGANVDAIGAWLEVRVGDRVQRRELSIGGGHAGGQLGWSHFGLGSAASAEVRIQWPDGTVGAWQSVEANQWLDISR
jgi:enediyne biosynthesis protein E4